jgi:hypothetical protein
VVLAFALLRSLTTVAVDNTFDLGIHQVAVVAVVGAGKIVDVSVHQVDQDVKEVLMKLYLTV